MKTYFKIWFMAMRPKTLWAAVAPVLVGTTMAYSDGFLHLPSAVIAMLCSLLIQIGTNFANDYYDFVKGADTKERRGPVRATQAGLIKPGTMKAAFILVFLLAFIGGLYLVWRGGWPIFLIGVLSLLFGFLYTGGPMPLSYLGLGDIFVTIFFGPVAVGGTYFVQAGTISWIVVVAGLSPGLIATSILVANNLRDIATDLKAGKKTLAVRFGERFSKFQYFLSLFSAALIPVMLYVFTREHPYSVAAVVIMLFSIPTLRIIFEARDGEAMNKALANTGKLLLLYSLLFSIGWLF